MEHKQNTYPKLKGFGLRVHRAEMTLRRFARNQDYFPFTRAFENCFEMGDGEAVVFALMAKAKAEPDQFGQSLLTEGIRLVFHGNLNMEGFPFDWVYVYERAPQPIQRELFEGE